MDFRNKNNAQYGMCETIDYLFIKLVEHVQGKIVEVLNLQTKVCPAGSSHQAKTVHHRETLWCGSNNGT